MQIAIEEVAQEAVHSLEADGLVRCHRLLPRIRDDGRLAARQIEAGRFLPHARIRIWPGPSRFFPASAASSADSFVTLRRQLADEGMREGCAARTGQQYHR